MISLKEFNVKKVSENGNEASFEVGPLPTGFGHTLGNTLKRVLTASIPGAGITSIKIDGVEHEYSTMKGVQEDVITIILALKNVVFFSKSLETVRLNVDVKGEKGKVVEVKASDFEKNSDIEVINPDVVIAHLTDDKARFKAQITIERGIGYSLPNDKVRQELGVLPVDAIFSPVKLVNYQVAATRVGQETELDKIVLSVKTNGAVTPSESMSIACNIIGEMAANFVNKTEDMVSGKVEIAIDTLNTATEVEVVEEENKPKLLVSELNLTTRLTNALLRAGFDDLNKLEGFTEEELANIRGMGEKSLLELIDILKQNKVKLV